MDFVEVTNKVTGQMSGDTETIRILMELDIPKVDVIANLVALTAGSHFPETLNRGQEAQGLSDWHKYLRNLCTEQFDQCRSAYPDLGREEINGLDEMIVLNGIRRGVKYAMGYSYSHSPRWLTDKQLSARTPHMRIAESSRE